jgi:hypothetical protein
VRQKLPKRTQILYGCNWYPDVNAVNWWDAVDLIGVDAYYPLSQSQYPSLSELKSNWKPIMNNLNSIHQKFGKKIVFAEIGYASYADAAKNPAGCCWGGNRNDLQQNLFEAFFETVWTQPWFGGAFWWDWEVQKKYTDFYSNNYDSLGKPAQDVVKKYYKQQSMSFEAENSEFLQ